MSAPQLKKGLRWWPAAVIVGAATLAIVSIRSDGRWSFQERNLGTLSVVSGAVLLLFLWWLAFSRVAWRLRIFTAAMGVMVVALIGVSFRFRGVSGDLVPILDFRWKIAAVPTQRPAAPTAVDGVTGQDYPQFLGPNRDGQLFYPTLHKNWAGRPPVVIWRQPIGSAWSGWAIVGNRAFTQEQTGDEEWSSCYELRTGKLLWSHAERLRYQNALAGEGPRCTPTVASNRVFTLGATGVLNCLDPADGHSFWRRSITEDARSQVPEWGFAGSPLVYDGKVVVSAGGHSGRSLLAYRVDSGEMVWATGERSASYASPLLTTLCGVRQVLAFNSRYITSHAAESGAVLWEYPWGAGNPQASAPLILSTNRVLFSSGYGVGSELLELKPEPGSPRLSATRVWRSRQLKSKFADLLQRDGLVFGLDDGVLTCLDLKDGSRQWREGRYGHGQALLVNDLLLLMAENGELILLQPTASGPNELQRFRVFSEKTWNPIALSGDLVLVRNDQEAACVRLPVEGAGKP